MGSEAVLLGLVQGVTEFLPVSSSGHLALAKIIAGYGDVPLAYDIVLHVATLLAVFIYFFNDIASLLFEWGYGFVNANARRWGGWRFGWAVILGSVVTAPIGLLLKPFVEAISASLPWLGVNFLITGVLILSSKFFKSGDAPIEARCGIFVGLLQGIAVFPGISRSGATIWGGLTLGLSRAEAFRFSFLLSIPAICGAVILEVRDLGYAEFFASLPVGWLFGAVAAFAAGFLSLVALRKLITSDSWWGFSFYCMALGVMVLIYSLMGA
jgi:undecaprenyl-diphosphatase